MYIYIRTDIFIVVAKVIKNHHDARVLPMMLGVFSTLLLLCDC